MSLVRWDDESAVRSAVGLVGMVVFVYVFATTDPRYYLHLPAVLGIETALWVLILAVVPSLRGKPGTPHRALILIGQYAVFFAIFLVVGRAAISN